MKVEGTIAKEKTLPNGAAEALQKEFGRRLAARYPDCKLTVRRAGRDGLTVYPVLYGGTACTI
ncbi:MULTISPECIES: DinI-like family protein [unclassified Symbiopectobacterium]|uniref:DinI-like family protein n=1 Tax=unclassified Symbiopectobacterium TaxID=2794573 RepID=UPI0022279BF4|nr:MULTISPECIES: DinI-like family protein [unclassified Symbiopectobacterium]MCW2474105.1 DinI-like family protein [Candidatus Symbiopectobacterium sp. NZEC151]MCW2482584.1 DinI-like family protein [Candidatus Symbiopectobacterium sp. NZEC135]